MDVHYLLEVQKLTGPL